METITTRTHTQRMLQVIGHHWLSCCLYVAARLNIADHLASGPKSISDLANTTGSDAPSLYRVLRALVSEGIFQEPEKDIFALTPDAMGLVADAPGTMKHFILAELGEFYNPWGQLLHSVQTGEPAFNHYYKMDLWQFYASHAEEGANFMQAMTRLTQYTDKAIVETYDFSAFNTIIDVGGGNGALLMSILKNNPQLHGTVFDAPYVVEKTNIAISENNLDDKCDAQGGDFFEFVPAGADAYIMKYILHDWHENDAIRLLRNCANAMKKGSKLLAVDAVIPENSDPHPGKFMDINMLVATGGRERTESEFRHLFEKSGLRFNKVIHLQIPDVSIIEGEKE